MMGDVVKFPGITTRDIDPEWVLKEALEHGLTEVVICGYDLDGNEYHASSVADGGQLLWHLKRCEVALMRTVDESSE